MRRSIQLSWLFCFLGEYWVYWRGVPHQKLYTYGRQQLFVYVSFRREIKRGQVSDILWSVCSMMVSIFLRVSCVLEVILRDEGFKVIKFGTEIHCSIHEALVHLEHWEFLQQWQKHFFPIFCFLSICNSYTFWGGAAHTLQTDVHSTVPRIRNPDLWSYFNFHLLCGTRRGIFVSIYLPSKWG